MSHMERKWLVFVAVLELGLGFVLSSCAISPLAEPPATTPVVQQAHSSTPTASPVQIALQPSTPQPSPTSSFLSPNESFIKDLRQKNSGLGSLSDSNLVTIGTEFCAKLRAGASARQLMQNGVASISSMYMSGQITALQEKDLANVLADVDEKATVHFCPEQEAQVLNAFAQMASGQ